MARKRRNSKAGRPRKQVSARSIKRLAKLGCTNEEIADVLNISPDTLVRNFADVVKAGRQDFHMSIRRNLTKQMNDGKPGPTIFLAKNELGMRDVVHARVGGDPDAPPVKTNVTVTDSRAMSPEARRQRIKELAAKAGAKAVTMEGAEVVAR